LRASLGSGLLVLAPSSVSARRNDFSNAIG
jgi:hypothetical protein